MHPRAAASLLQSHPVPWGRYLLFSVAAHLAAVGALVAVQTWGGGPRLDLDAKPIEASLVRLGKPRDPKALPRLEAATPEPSTPTATTPDSAPPPVPTPVPSVKPTPPSHTPTSPADAAARRAQLFGAFNKFSRTAHVAEQEGALDGDPNGDSAKQEGERYWGLLKAQVRQHYDVSQTIPDDERIRLHAQVALRISRSGEVLKVQMAHPSGNALFDSAVLAAVQRASPLPPPPDTLRERLQREGVVLEFRP